MKKEIALAFAGFAVLAVAVAAGCGGPVYTEPKEVEAKPPTVSYNFGSDEDLIAANTKARVYCSQYASTPSMQGSITENSDGTKTVTFECIKTAGVAPPPPPPPPMSYSYRTDMELLQAIQSSEAYCARTGQAASSSIVANPDGTKTLTFQCVPR
jgi:hypothetical protein